MKDNSVAVIIPYFGKLPWYFKYFLHTCRYNKEIHFYILTDDTTEYKDLPKNVFLMQETREQLKNKIEKKLQFKIQLPEPYKICDFRPTFGLVFSDLLAEYTFWGMGDIDVIFGNIKNFITEALLNVYDVISVRHDFLVGYFSLFRNTEVVNTLFRQSRDYKKVFTSSEHFCFDESNFAYRQMDDVITFEDVVCEIDSMTHVVKRLHNKKTIKAYFNVHVIEGLPGKLTWEKGILTYRNQYEILLYHMIQFKQVYNKKYVKHIPDKFQISPSRIY